MAYYNNNFVPQASPKYTSHCNYIPHAEIDPVLNQKINSGQFKNLDDQFFPTTRIDKFSENVTGHPYEVYFRMMGKIIFKLYVNNNPDHCCYLFYTEDVDSECLQVLFMPSKIFNADYFDLIISQLNYQRNANKIPPIQRDSDRVYSLSEQNASIQFARLPFDASNNPLQKDYGYIVLSKKKIQAISVNSVPNAAELLRTFIQFFMPTINFKECSQDTINKQPKGNHVLQEFLKPTHERLFALLMDEKPQG